MDAIAHIYIYRFGSSAAITAWVGGTQAAVRMLLSPLGTTLSNRFSARWTIVVGGLLLGGGTVISSFAPSVEFLFFSHSFICGAGGALAYAPSLVLVGQYFSKYQGLAQGIATGSSGTGLFVFPFLMDWLLDYYGFTGGLLMFGALLLHCCVSGVLSRPLIQSVDLETRQAYKQYKKSSSDKTLKNRRKDKWFDLNLLKDPTLLRLAISLCFITMCYIPSQMLIMDLAISKGVSSNKAGLLISVVGITDMLSAILCGLLKYHHHCVPGIGIDNITTCCYHHQRSYLIMVIMALRSVMCTQTSMENNN